MHNVLKRRRVKLIRRSTGDTPHRNGRPKADPKPLMGGRGSGPQDQPSDGIRKGGGVAVSRTCHRDTRVTGLSWMEESRSTPHEGLIPTATWFRTESGLEKWTEGRSGLVRSDLELRWTTTCIVPVLRDRNCVRRFPAPCRHILASSSLLSQSRTLTATPVNQGAPSVRGERKTWIPGHIDSPCGDGMLRSGDRCPRKTFEELLETEEHLR